MSSLSADLALDLGGDVSVIVPGGSSAVQIDHVATALSRLPAQFVKPRILAALAAFVAPMQDAETALFQLLTQRGLDAAIGVQLDAIGAIVGQPRAGLDDDTYRVYVRARIAANRSRGTVNDLLRVLNLILLGANATITIETVGPAFAEIRITATDISDTTATIVLSFAQACARGGVRIVVVSTPSDAHTFTTAGSLFNDHAFDLSATLEATTDGTASPTTTLTTVLSEWPATGTLRIDTGTASEETRTYTARSLLVGGQGVRFTLSSALVISHAAGAQVELVTSPSLGFGDATELGQPQLFPYIDAGSIGGRLADARG